jgi:hypothetical protein
MMLTACNRSAADIASQLRWSAASCADYQRRAPVCGVGEIQFPWLGHRPECHVCSAVR